MDEKGLTFYEQNFKSHERKTVMEISLVSLFHYLLYYSIHSIKRRGTLINFWTFGTEKRDFFRGTLINFWPSSPEARLFEEVRLLPYVVTMRSLLSEERLYYGER